jgi:protein gp37
MKNSAIEWTHHTFNPWHGCLKVSPGCTNCYAETLSKRFGRSIWGPASTTPRKAMSENYWRQPETWNREAEQAGERKRVFCASMGDWAEDHPMVTPWRRRLFDLIPETPWLDWLLLTKRMDADWIMSLVPWGDQWPDNVWLGTSVENQACAEDRIPELISIPARVRFLSCEPLLGPIEFLDQPWWDWRYTYKMFQGAVGQALGVDQPPIHWVIAGGESGHGARPMHPDWVRSLRDQCQEAEIPFLFKQWGNWRPVPLEREMWHDFMDTTGKIGQCKQRADGNWHQDMRGPDPVVIQHFKDKHKAGRELDGVIWDQFPEVVTRRPL